MTSKEDFFFLFSPSKEYKTIKKKKAALKVDSGLATETLLSGPGPGPWALGLALTPDLTGAELDTERHS